MESDQQLQLEANLVVVEYKTYKSSFWCNPTLHLNQFIAATQQTISMIPKLFLHIFTVLKARTLILERRLFTVVL